MHVIAGLICCLAVIVAAVIIMQVKGDGRYYADPGASIVIGLVIVTFAARLGKFLHTLEVPFTYITLAKQIGIFSTNNQTRIYLLGMATLK